MNEFVFTTTTNSFVRFLGEFEDTKKSFRNYLTFTVFATQFLNFCFLGRFFSNFVAFSENFNFVFLRHFFLELFDEIKH